MYLPHLERLQIHKAHQPDLGLADTHKLVGLLPKLNTVGLGECNANAVEPDRLRFLSLPSVKEFCLQISVWRMRQAAS